MKVKEIRYNMMHYLFGALPARLGDDMSGQAILLLGIAVGSTTLGSTLLASLTFSAAVGGPLLGVLLDRAQHPGKVLALSLGLYATGIALIAWSLGHVPMWISLVLALAVGLLMPAISGGWSSQLKSFIAEEQITRASAIDATTFNIAGLAGPALAGLIAGWLGAHWAVAVLTGLLIAALPMAWVLPKRKQKIKSQTGTLFLRDALAGLKVIVINKSLFRITLLSVISYMGIGMLWVVCPLIGQHLLGNPGFGGVLASVVSVGALIATAIYAKWPTKHTPDTVALATACILAIAMFALAFASSISVVLIVMLVIGLADGPQLAAIFAVRHREAPERVRSQVFTTGASLKITAAALGVLLAGHLAVVSLEVTLFVSSFIQVCAAGAYLLIKR